MNYSLRTLKIFYEDGRETQMIIRSPKEYEAATESAKSLKKANLIKDYFISEGS